MTDLKEKMAFLIIDMVKDNFDEAKKFPITPLAKQITLSVIKGYVIGRVHV
jgi:hypothetical protein